MLVSNSLPNINSQHTQVKQKNVSPFKKSICGDIFGSSMLDNDNSMLGMMYRSRVHKKKTALNGDKNIVEEERFDDILKDEKIPDAIDVFDGSSDSDNETADIINPRHRLALTIRNWSVHPENDSQIIEEGAVHALIALAGTEDHHIKQCCASALYHLSCRPKNRSELISLGSATGVITIALSVRHWKVAKLCAQTLCNLTMEAGGESALAKEGAVLALVILLGVRSNRLAPTCVQALYNLTCVKEPFKGMERIIKALLTLPSLPFDATPSIVSAVVNFSRFSNLRNRIVEDGALQIFSACVNSFSHRESNPEEREGMVYNVACAIAQLSETPSCRGDMISKGAIELLQQILPFCNEKSRLLVIKSLHNFLTVVHTFPTIIFEIGVNLVTDVINHTYDDIALQYCAACFYHFTLENMRDLSRLAVRVVKSLPRLLLCSNQLTQYYSIITTSLMFFSELVEDISLLVVLAGKAVEAGYTVRDISSIRALVQAFAQLTQESRYIIELEKEHLLKEMMSLMLTLIESGKDDPLILEGCCVGVCRICLQLKDIEPKTRELIAKMLFEFLDVEDPGILCNVVSSIRALLENGICHQELLSDELLVKIANITIRFSDDKLVRRVGCAILTVLSYDRAAHHGLASDVVISVIFQMTRSDDIMTRELVAACLCNISIDDSCRRKLIASGIVDVMGSLSGVTSERIQELCAKCICNLTCTTDMQQFMISNNILQTTLMISLVRSVSNTTKHLCALALLNMISDQNLKAIIDAGVIRVFSTLALLDDLHTQNICAQGFLMLSAMELGREAIVQKRTVAQSLFSLVKTKTAKTKSYMGKAIFNLLSDVNSRERVIRAGALSVVKILASEDSETLRQGVAKMIIILSQTKELEKFCKQESVVPMLVMIANSSREGAFESTIHAFSCLSQHKKFRAVLIQNGCISAIVGAIIDGKVETIQMAEEACRCMCMLSLSRDHAEMMILNEHIMIALHLLYSGKLYSKISANMILLILRNLSCCKNVCRHIVSQDGIKLLWSLLKDFASNNPSLVSSAMLVIHNIGKVKELHSIITDEGLMTIISFIAELHSLQVDGDDSPLPSPQVNERKNRLNFQNEESDIESFDDGKAFLNQDTIYDIIMAIQLISQTPSCREKIVQGHVIKVFNSFLENLNDISKYEMALSLGHLSISRECRVPLVDQGAVDLLVTLSHSEYFDTQTQCSEALGHLSENTKVKSGTVASLLLLSLKEEDHRESTVQISHSRRASTGFAADPGSLINVHISAPAKELAALQSVKSLKVMIMDGLARKRGISHHIAYSIDEASLTSSADFQGISLQDLDKIGGPEFTQYELSFIVTDYSTFHYTTTSHFPSQLQGGMSKKIKVDLPYPVVSIHDVDKADRSGLLVEVPMSRGSLPKNVTEHKIREVIRYASSNIIEGINCDANDVDEFKHWEEDNVNSPKNGKDDKAKKGKKKTKVKRSSPNLMSVSEN